MFFEIIDAVSEIGHDKHLSFDLLLLGRQLLFHFLVGFVRGSTISPHRRQILLFPLQFLLKMHKFVASGLIISGLTTQNFGAQIISLISVATQTKLSGQTQDNYPNPDISYLNIFSGQALERFLVH